jgi:hypothetical protein
MRFLSLYRPATEAPATPEKMAAMQTLIEDMRKAGVLLDTGALLPSAHGARVKQAAGKHTVTDGPFPETKELIVGYAFLQARTKAEAIEHTRRFLKIAGDGEAELLQVMDGPP